VFACCDCGFPFLWQETIAMLVGGQMKIMVIKMSLGSSFHNSCLEDKVQF